MGRVEFLARYGRQPSMVRWFGNVPSPSTQRTYLWAMERFVNFSDKSPDDLVKIGQADSEDAHDALKHFYSTGCGGLSSRTRFTAYQALRSLLGANRVRVGRKPAGFRGVVEFEPSRLYTQDEVAMLVDAATCLRDKAMICFLAQSGQRVGVVCALRLGMVDLDQPDPILVDVPGVLKNHQEENVNKIQSPYIFALGQDAKDYLGLMVEDRQERGEPLSVDSWLFRSFSVPRGYQRIRKVSLSEPGRPLSVSQAGQIVRDAAERRGIQVMYGKRHLFHPHGFRRYWKHQLRGVMDPGLLEYMMGHKPPYGGAYDRWTREDIRAPYKQAENSIRLRPRFGVTPEEIQEEVVKVLLHKLSEDEMGRIASRLGIPKSQILSMLKLLATGREEQPT